MKKMLYSFLLLAGSLFAQTTGPYTYSIAGWGWTNNKNMGLDTFCHFGFDGGTVKITKFTVSGTYASSANGDPAWIRFELFRRSQRDTNAPQCTYKGNGKNYGTDPSFPPMQSNPMCWGDSTGQPVSPLTDAGVMVEDSRLGDSIGIITLWPTESSPLIIRGSNDGICLSLGTEATSNLLYFDVHDEFTETVP